MSLDVSVVVVTYNQADKLRRALDSAISQTRRPDQIVVSDDASTDGTQAVIEEYADRYPDLIDGRFHERNRGIPANVNDGLDAVEGDVFTILPGDDWFLPQKLERELDCYRESDGSVVFSDVEQRNENGADERWYGDDHPPTGDVFRDVFARDFWFRAWLQPTETLDTVGYWDERYDVFADWDYTIRLTEQCDVAYVPAVLSGYRNHGDSVSGRLELRDRRDGIERVYERNRARLDRLDLEDRVYVDRRVRAELSYLSSRAALADGQYLRAARELLRYLRNDERDTTLPEIGVGFLRGRLSRLL